MVTVTRLEGRRLLCRAGRHEVITDRKTDEGGADSGCTSGELLLMAIGSCAAGGVRRHLEARGLAENDFAVEVTLEPSPTGAERPVIVIDVNLAPALAGEERGIEVAATTGRVTSRICLGSEVQVRASVKSAIGSTPAPARTAS